MSLVTDDLRAKADELWHGNAMCQNKSKLLLTEMGLPKGLLPLKDIEECGYIKDSGFFWLKQKKSTAHKFDKIGKQAKYASEITGYIDKGVIKKLSGVKSKEIMVWITISEIFLDDPPTGNITFKSPTGLSRVLPASAFEVDAGEAAEI